MLLAALMFWHVTTSTFHRHVQPFPFDLATIAGIRPNGPLPDLCFVKEKDPNLRPISAYAFNTFLERNMKTGSEPISTFEHVAFLQYWLYNYLFCSTSVALAANLLPITMSLHLEKLFCLGILLLGYLYKNLD
jgi:hypothetical protein